MIIFREPQLADGDIVERLKYDSCAGNFHVIEYNLESTLNQKKFTPINTRMKGNWKTSFPTSKHLEYQK